MARFVIIEHDYPTLHWDLMLEDEGSLRTWRLSELPVSGKWVEAEEIAPHRLAYLDYEGEVSGGRGSVKRWERGTFEWPGYVSPFLFDLKGEKRRGMMSLFERDGHWRCKWVFDAVTEDSA